eukprot:TRINITY_DN1327_c0_g1_i7.p1 TRINITY_DN1327_c0_g1~~TRINITY_DN1327_c0_g1_i7.p1  ORF type:complete len:397 (+),score=71.75 TRINITY_DN1327_c0_g1_i7:211-1401(+)
MLASKTFQELLVEANAATERLRKLGTFSGVQSSLDEGSTPRSGRLHVKVQEHRLFNASIGGFAGSEEFSGTGTLNLWNPLGGTESMDLNLSYGSKNKLAAEFHFCDPRFLQRRLQLDVRAFRRMHNKRDRCKHDEAVAGITTGLGAVIHEATGWRGTLLHEFSHRVITPLDTASSELKKETALESSSIKSSILLSATRDTRDGSAFPKSGTFTQGKLEVAGLGGNARFWKLEGSVQQYLSLPQGLTLLLQANAGVASPWGQDRLRVSDRFFIGGAPYLRGFAPRGVGVKDADTHLGGDLFGQLCATVFVPIRNALLPGLDAHGFGYVGAGNLVDSTRANSRPEAVKELVSEARVSVGVGIAAVVPAIGRVEVSYSYPVRKQEDPTSPWVLGVGVSI